MKKWIFSFALALVMSSLSLFSAQAAPPSIKFDKGFPSSPAGGKINGSGALSFDNDVWAPVTVNLMAMLPGGGEGGEEKCTLAGGPPPTSWSGQIVGLPAGSYQVIAVFTLRNKATSALVPFYTPLLPPGMLLKIAGP